MLVKKKDTTEYRNLNLQSLVPQFSQRKNKSTKHQEYKQPLKEKNTPENHKKQEKLKTLENT